MCKVGNMEGALQQTDKTEETYNDEDRRTEIDTGVGQDFPEE